MADEGSGRRWTAQDWYRTPPGSQGGPGGGPPPAAGQAQQAPRWSAANWYGGRNMGGTESGWNSDFFNRSLTQYEEQRQKLDETGNPGDFYSWFQREDATGVATWNDQNRKVRAENGKMRGLRAGDVFDNGEFVHNVYDVYDKKDADLMVGEFVFDGSQKARLFEQDAKIWQKDPNAPGAFSAELQREIEKNSDMAEFGAQSFETRERVAEKAAENDKKMGIWDEVATFAAGFGGGAATGAVFMNPFTIIGGGIAGGFSALANADQFGETVARAQVQAERAKEQGQDANKWGSYLQTGGAILMQSVSPLQNAVSGAFDVIEGDWGDSVSEFNAVDPDTGERKASGAWQAAHLLAVIPDSFLQFGSKAALAMYQTSLVLSVGGKTTNLAQNTVWSDAEGGWHEMEDWGERGSSIAGIAIDTLQLGTSQFAVRAAQMAKKATAGGDEVSRTATGALTAKIGLGDDWAAQKADEVWSRLPGLTKAGRENRQAYREAMEEAKEKGIAPRAAEQVSGRRVMFDAAGNPIAYRTTAVAMVPSELTRWLPATMTARYKAIRRNGGSSSMATVEDVYEASLKMSGNGGRMSDAMLNAFAEGSEEMAQTFFDTESYSGEQSVEEILRSGAYGFASGLGMGIGPMLSRAGTEKQEMHKGYILEQIRTGDQDLTREEWKARWDAMTPAERKRASTGNSAEIKEAAAIGHLIAERHRMDVNRNGILPYLAQQGMVEAGAKDATKKANDVSESATTAKLLPADVFTSRGDEKSAKEKGVVFRRPAFPAEAAAMTSKKMVHEYGMKVKALRDHLESMAPDHPDRAELEVELAIVQAIHRAVKGLAESSWKDEDPERRQAKIRAINALVWGASVYGDLDPGRNPVTDKDGNPIPINPDQVRRAAKLMFARHPFIDAASFFTTIPQVHMGYELDNMHGSIGLGLWFAKGAQLDFDGDAPVLLQVLFDPQTEARLSAGVQYMRRTDEGYEVIIDRPKDERDAINYLYVTHGAVKDKKRDPRAVARRKILNKLRRDIRKYVIDVLEPVDGDQYPFVRLWQQFEHDLDTRNPKAVENFINAVVNHNHGKGGELLAQASVEAHRPLLMVLHQEFTVGLEGLVRQMKIMDPAVMDLVADEQDKSRIPETNRKYFKALTRKYASTVAQSVQLAHGYSGERASGHLKYSPFLTAAIGLTFSKPEDHLTPQEIALAKEFYLEAGPGDALSENEQVDAKEVTTRRVLGWAESFGKELRAHLEASTMTLDLMDQKGLEFLVAGLRAPDVMKGEDGQPQVRGVHGARRSDISLAQLLLRKSVAVDRARHDAARSDDTIRSNLSRLDGMSNRRGERSITWAETLAELYGDTHPAELLGDEVSQLVWGMTMHEILDMFRTMGKDEIRIHLNGMKGGHTPYVAGHRKDAPWSIGDVQEMGLNPYTLFVDALSALANSEHGTIARKGKSLGGEVRASLLLVGELRDKLLNGPEYAPQIRAYLQLDPGTELTEEHVSDYILYNEAVAKELVELFPEKARPATFKIVESVGIPTSRRWVSQVLIEKDPGRAELMLLVESAIDLLNAEGGRFLRDDSGRIISDSAKPANQAGNIESRLAILLNRLAMQPSTVELTRFFEMYQKALDAGGNDAVEKFFNAVNAETHWLNNEPDLLPYADSIKDFETDPKDVWNSGTMYTERTKKLTGMSERLRLITESLSVSAEKVLKDSALINDLDAYDEIMSLPQEDRDREMQARGITLSTRVAYEQLDTARRYALDTSTTYGARILDHTMMMANESVDQSNKGAADERWEAFGDVYVLGTSIGLQTAAASELTAISAYSVDDIRMNPDLLKRGPAVIQDKDGGSTEIDLTTNTGIIKAMKDPSMRAIVDMVIWPMERDINGSGALQMYSKFPQAMLLSEKLEQGPSEVVWDYDNNMSLEQAEYVITTFDKRLMTIGRESGEPAVVQETFLPIQGMLNKIMIAYTSSPKWSSYTLDQQEQARDDLKIKVAKMLVKISQLGDADSIAEAADRIEQAMVHEWVQAKYGAEAVDRTWQSWLAHQDPGVRNELVQEFLALYSEELLRQSRDAQAYLQKLEALEAAVEAAEKSKITKDIKAAKKKLKDSGLSRDVYEEMMATITEAAKMAADDPESIYPPMAYNKGMNVLRAAMGSYMLEPGDDHRVMRIKRERLLEAVNRLSQRTAGKKEPEMIRQFLRAAQENPLGYLDGTIIGDELDPKQKITITDEMVKNLSIMAAKQAMADYHDPSGSSILLATNPGMDESDGFFLWDETFSYLARPLFSKHVLEAAQWFNGVHKTGSVSVEEVVKFATSSGPFNPSDFGKWNAAIVGATMNMQKAMEGASVGLAATIGGNLPKTQYDAAVASYSEWDAQVKPEHHSIMDVALSRRPPKDEDEETARAQETRKSPLAFGDYVWTGRDQHRSDVDVPAPLAKLHLHFVSAFDIESILEQVAAAMPDDESVIKYLMWKYDNSREEAERELSKLRKRNINPTTYLLDSLRKQLEDVTFTAPEQRAHDGYKVFDAVRLAKVFKDIQLSTGLEGITFSVRYVDVDKKPFNAEYRNHGMFDGLGRDPRSNVYISPWAATIFGIGALSKDVQQQIFDYAAKGGSSYKPHFPITRRDYERMIAEVRAKWEEQTRKAAAGEGGEPYGLVTMTMRQLAQHMMTRNFTGHNRLVADDWNAVYKMVMSRHIYQGADPTGKVRLMWAEEVISYENDPAHPDFDSSKLEMIPLSEEVFRILHGDTIMESGRAVTRPEWNIDKIDKNPSLDPERLERLGLSRLGKKVAPGTTELSMVTPPQERFRSSNTARRAAIRTSLKKRAEEGLARRARANEDRKKPEELQHIRKHRRKVLKSISEDLEADEINAIARMVGVALVTGDENSKKDAAKAIKRYEDSVETTGKVFYVKAGETSDPVMGTLNEASFEVMDGSGTWPVWGDLVALDLSSFMAAASNNEDAAAEKVQAIIEVLARRGVTIVLTGKTTGSFSMMMSQWMAESSIAYTRSSVSRHVWEPITEKNFESATAAALRTSLSETTSFLARNAHVTLHLDEQGHLFDENAGGILTPDQLDTPHRRQWVLLPQKLGAAKFGRPRGEYAFKPPVPGTQEYKDLVQAAREFVSKSQDEMAVMASMGWARAEDGWKPGDPVWVSRTKEIKDPSDPTGKRRITVPDTDPKNVEQYKVFEETGTEIPGIRGFEDAYKRLLNTLMEGNLPLGATSKGNMAGDFTVGKDSKGRIFFYRIGFEVPTVDQLDQIFADGNLFGVVPPKMDKATTVPPDFEVVQAVHTKKGVDYEISVPLSIWSKIIMEGDGVKYTMSSALQSLRAPELRAGANGRDVTFLNSSSAQEAKFGMSVRATRLKGMWTITGADHRLALVNSFTPNRFTSTDEPGFEKAWKGLLPVLERWSQSDFGMDEGEIRNLMSQGRLFEDDYINLRTALGDHFQRNKMTGQDLEFEFKDYSTLSETQKVEQRIADIYMATLMVRRITPQHITATPGVWTVEDPLTNPAAIIHMPDLMSDLMGEDQEIIDYYVKAGNSRVQRFPPDHPLAGQPVVYFDSDLRMHKAMEELDGRGNPTGRWMRISGWASVDFPFAATQNDSIYANTGMLNKNSGYTQHVAAVIALAANGRMPEKKLKPGERSVLDKVFDADIVEFDDNPMKSLLKILKMREPDGSFVITDPEQRMTAVEMATAARVRAAYEDFEYHVDRTGPDWKDSSVEIEKAITSISSRTGITDRTGGLTRMLDTMVRMYFGMPGPIGKNQNDWKDRVTPKMYLEALRHFERQLKDHRDPMEGGALGMMPPSFAVALYKAGQWQPSMRVKRNGVQELATSWDQWVQSIFGQWVNSGTPFEPMWIEEMDGLIQVWKDYSKLLDGFGVSIDTIRNLLPKNRQLRETLESLDLFNQRVRNDPLILETWDQVSAVFNDERTPTELSEMRESKLTAMNDATTHRLEWLAKKKIPKALDKKMKPKDFLSDGVLYIDERAGQNRVFNFLTNLSHITRLLDPAIYASGYIEQPYRMMFEHLTDLLTGRYTGRGAVTSARRKEALKGSKLGQKVMGSQAWDTLGFGDFKQSFTAEDLVSLDRLATSVGSDKRWLELLYEEAQYANVVQAGGESAIETKVRKMAGGVAKVVSDPLFGTSQKAAAKRYLTGVLTHMHAMGQHITVAQLADKLGKDPRWLEKAYGNVGLNAHKAGMNSVLQIRSQKLTPFSRAISSSINSMLGSPNRMFQAFGFAANIPFAYTRFMANGLQFITGMDGWSQAASMFFAGRQRPKWLRGGVNGNPDYWDLEDVLETMDLRRTFIRSGTTLTMLFTLGMLAGGTFGFLGENEEERRRRKQGMYMGIVDYKDPREPENNFLNADAIFFDSIPALSNLFDDGQGANAIVPHWVLRQITSPILGMSRFFKTGDFREVGYGFLDAFTAVPNSVMRLYHEADTTARMLFDEALAAEEQGDATGIEQANKFIITAFGIYERALFENQMINGLLIGKDKYDRDPWSIPMEPGEEPHIGPDGQPLPTKAMESYLDPETGEVMNSYLTRKGADGVMHQYAENNMFFGHFMYLISGGDGSYLRQNMVTRKRELEMDPTDEAKAEAAIYSLYLQQGGGLEGLTKEEIAYALKDRYSAQDVWWDEETIEQEAAAIYESGDAATGALSFMTPQGEVLSDYGGDRIIEGIWKGSIKLGSPELIGVAMPPDMRKRISVVMQQRLVEDGLKLGLPQKTAEYRAKRFWFGDEETGEPGLREIVWSDQIPYSNKVEYNQLNVMYMMGPDGKPWATPFERKTMGQVFFPFPHNQVMAGSGLGRDERGMMYDEVLGIHTGLAGIERIPTEAFDFEPDDTMFKVSDTTDSSKNSKPWKKYPRSGGYGGGGGGGGYTPQMRALPGGTAARFDGIQMINSSNPIIRRANVNRQRIWSERGRLKQWQ